MLKASREQDAKCGGSRGCDAELLQRSETALSNILGRPTATVVNASVARNISSQPSPGFSRVYSSPFPTIDYFSS